MGTHTHMCLPIMSLNVTGPGKARVELFARVLLEEFRTCWDDAFFAWDSITRERHLCKLVLLYCVVDTRGLGSVTNGMEHPSPVCCHKCDVVGVCGQHMVAPALFESWRMLAAKHPLRNEAAAARHPLVVANQHAPALNMRTRDSIELAGRMADNFEYAQSNPHHPSRRLFMKKSSYFQELLPYFSVPDNVLVDFAHERQNVGRMQAWCSLGIDKGDVSERAITLETEERPRFTPEHFDLEQAPWQMSTNEVLEFNRSCILLNI